MLTHFLFELERIKSVCVCVDVWMCVVTGGCRAGCGNESVTQVALDIGRRTLEQKSVCLCLCMCVCVCLCVSVCVCVFG
jgi:hypothetical protein